MAKKSKFTQFDSTNCGRAITGALTLSFSEKGPIVFSKALSERMALKVGTTVVFLRDEEEDEWYIALNQKEGFKVRQRSGGDFTFNSSTLVAHLFKSIDFDKPSGRMLVAEPRKEDDLTVWPLLTSSMQHRERKSRA